MFTSKTEEFREERSSKQFGSSRPTDAPPPPSSDSTSQAPKFNQQKPSQEKQSPKQSKKEKFHRTTKPSAGDHSPFCDDTYYSKTEESDDTTDSSRVHRKVHVVRESHVKVMSDKKSEYYSSRTNDGETPKQQESAFQAAQTPKFEAKQPKVTIAKTELRVQQPPLAQEQPQQLPIQVSPKPALKLKSTDLVKNAQFDTMTDLKLEPLPFEAGAPKPPRAKVPPPPKPSKFIRGDFTESEYESDADIKFRKRWQPDTGSETDEPSYAKIKVCLPSKERPHLERDRTPTPPSKFDQPPTFEGPPRPKVEFPESEPEYERPPSPVVIEKKKSPIRVPSKIQMRTIKPMTAELIPPKEPSPELVPEPVAEVGFIPAPSVVKVSHITETKTEMKPAVRFQEVDITREGYEATPSPIVVEKKMSAVKAPSKMQMTVVKPKPAEVVAPKRPSPDRIAREEFIPSSAPTQIESNAFGIESTKITTISDSSQFHKRFITQQHTTKVFKLSDVKKTEQPPKPDVKVEFVSQQDPPPPSAEELPFTPLPKRSRKEKGVLPSKPKKFQKGEFRDSDYDSDYDARIKPKWLPPDSDADEPSYNKVPAPKPSERSRSHTRERTPTPPSAFDVPPPTGLPLRPDITELKIPRPEPVYQEPDVVELPSEPDNRKKVHREPTIPVKQQEPLKVEQTRVRRNTFVKDTSPVLPPAGPEPEIGIITTEYVVDNVKVEERPAPPKLKEVPTYMKKPYTEIVEKTEKIFMNKKMMEEVNIQKSRTEKITRTVHEFNEPEVPQTVEQQPQVSVQNLEKYVEVPQPAARQTPLKQTKVIKPPVFVKGVFTESDYESDFDGTLKPKWTPGNKEEDDIHYSKVLAPQYHGTKDRSKERTPTRPTVFDSPPAPQGGPLRPDIKMIEKVIIEPLDVPQEPPARPEIPCLPSKVEATPPKPAVRTVPKPEPSTKTPTVGMQHEYDIQHKFKVSVDTEDDYYAFTESDYSEVETKKTYPEPTMPTTQVKRPQVTSVPIPKKFMKGPYQEDDYSQPESGPIPSVWYPADSEGDEPHYRKVVPPKRSHKPVKPVVSKDDPLPPSKFDEPPQFEGPPRPSMERFALQPRERRESLEDYSIPRFPKVEFKPFEEDFLTNGHAPPPSPFVGVQLPEPQREY